ncbi:hypothetical protein A2415_00215 [candidate division WWE3 bacterium RIFOXYC1_FULL_39_7]|uniref:Uncharacterized protein n=1 Tax=candidate division WWE3 bacterium RIFOXYC1_FULL_39_7 TaxID=1802643 RepID=A0A1F4WIB8_UNCKA|nr:MAG: hypothetical protein A2415_00215 [candidate division WWE3 bacterium RIFOXYC1_FULL_39_7]
MSKENDLLVFSEFRGRIENLKSITNPGPFFREVARLTEWVENIEQFRQPILYLDFERTKRDKESLDILKNIYVEGRKIWLAIQKIPIKLETTPETIQNSLASLMGYYQMGHPYYTIGIYHNAKYIVEYLASISKNSKIERYVNRKSDQNLPLIEGKIHSLFLDYVKYQDVVKKELAITAWGAHSNLKHVVFLASMDNDYPQLDDWAKVFTVDEYLVYFYKLADYIFDWLFLSKKHKAQNLDQLDVYAIWDKKFKYEDATAHFAKYGSVKFYPQRSPIKLELDNKPGPTELILTELFGGKGKVDKSKLTENESIAARDLPSYANSINKTFTNATVEGKIKVTVQVICMKQYLKLRVIPQQINNETEHKNLS